MDKLYDWMRDLIVCFCMLELFCHLVRTDEYRRYIRFFGGLIVLLLALEPAGDLFLAGQTFEEALRRAFVREEAYELRVSQEALADLQNEQIEEAYRSELERQMREIAKANGRQCISVDVRLSKSEGNPAAISSVLIRLMPLNSNLNVFEKETDGARQQAGVDRIRAEIASVYGVEDIQISVKE